MKKLISLLLALVCLLSLTPVMAEEEAPAAPTVNLPITLEAYQQAYETLITTTIPDSKVTWSSAALEDGGEAWMGLINDTMVGVMLLPVDGVVTELAIVVQSDLTEDNLFAFLSMAGYAGAALLVDEDTTAEDAMNAFMNELFGVFTDITSGAQPEDIYGLPGGISITAMADNTEVFQYYFVLNLAQ